MIAMLEVRNAIKQLLAGDGVQVLPVADVLLVGRYRPIAEGEDTAVVVRWERSLADEQLLASAPVSWTTQLALDVYVRADGGDDAEQAAGPVLAAVYQRLRQADLAHLGVTALGADAEIQLGLEPMDPNVAGVTLFVNVQHDTEAQTLNVRT